LGFTLAVLRTSDMSVLTASLHVHGFEQVDAMPITSDHILPNVDRQRGAGDGARLVGGMKHALFRIRLAAWDRIGEGG
jgi:hypothetical protein